MRRSLTCLGVLFILQVGLCGQTKLPEWRKVGLDAAIDWIRDPEVFLDGRRPKRKLTLKVDRSALLQKALDNAKTLDRPVMWYVYRVVEKTSRGVQMYRAPILDIYMQHVLFADPDVASIVRNRFVALRMVVDEPMAERFKLRPLDFIEPAVVFLDKDGKILHKLDRIRTFNAHWFQSLLRRVLKKSGAKPAPKGTPIHKLIAQGRYDEALKVVESKPKPSQLDMLTMASLMRRLGRPEDATAVVMAAGDAKYHALVCTEMGLSMAQMGSYEEAAQQLEAAAAAAQNDAKDNGRSLYLRALLHLAQGHKKESEQKARDAFDQLAVRHRGTTWGRKARVNTMIAKDKRPMGPAFHGFESIEQMPKAAYEGLPRDTSWAGDPAKPEELILRSVKFLLRQQRPHGGFTDSRYAYWGTPKITPNAWVAITALSAHALARHRDRVSRHLDMKYYDEAIRKARDYVLDAKNMNRGENEDVYADAYRLIFLAHRSKNTDKDGQQNALAAMNEIILAAQKRQAEKGFWAHEYQNAFCTQAMLWALMAARDAGATVPDKVFERGLLALLSARHKNGAYVYGGAVNPKSKRMTSLKDACGRMPSCEGVLFAFKKSDMDKLQFAFDTFWKYMDRLEKVRRNDFHSDGQLAGFFFFHSLYHTSEVNRLLPSEQQKANKKKLLDLLLRVPEMDGSFVDSHEMGRSYGTAMALLTLANVLE